MAQLTNNVSVFKVPSVSGFGSNDDGVSGLILLSPIASGSSLTDEQVYKWRSIRDAEAAGLTYDGSELMDLAYIHVREFFRFNPSGTLWVILSTDDTQTFSSALGTGATTLAKKLLKAASGDIRILGIARVTDLATQVAGTGVAAEVESAIPVAQALIDDEFEPNKRPLDIILEGHGWAGTVTAATDLRTNTAGHVAVVIAQDPAAAAVNAAFAKHASVGTLLGVSAAAQVHESVGWVQENNILSAAAPEAFLDANLSDNNPASDYEADFDQLFEKGYVYAKKIAGVAGTYFVDAPTCAPRTQVVSFWRYARTLHKAAREVRNALLPHVNRPVDVDQDGNLAPRFVSFFEAQARAALDGMVAAGELVAFNVYVNPEQNITATQTVEVDYEIQPFGAANTIKANIALVPALSE